MKVSLVIPARNEQDRLVPTLDAYAQALRRRYDHDFEILVVANGCSDATAHVARSVAKRLPSLRVLDIAAPVGKGGAVIEGLR